MGKLIVRFSDWDSPIGTRYATRATMHATAVALAASALLEGGACAAPGRARRSRVGDGVTCVAPRDPVAPVAFFRVTCVNWRCEERG